MATAEEFEVQQRGPISILFIRLKEEAPRLSTALPIVDPTQNCFVAFLLKSDLVTPVSNVAPPPPKIAVSPLDVAKKVSRFHIKAIT